LQQVAHDLQDVFVDKFTIWNNWSFSLIRKLTQDVLTSPIVAQHGKYDEYTMNLKKRRQVYNIK